jgi:hypothetical protein
MRILNEENTPVDIDHLPESVDLRFCVLDNSDSKNPDFFFVPLIFLESFTDPVFVLKVGKYKINVPYNWKILIGDREVGDLEMLALTKLNDRGFDAFVFNPLSSYKPGFESVDIIDVFQDATWFFPKLRPGQILCLPLGTEKGSPCIYLVREISKSSEVVDLSLIV